MGHTYPNTRTELLARIATGREELERFVAELSDEQLVAPGPGGDWSIADHLYHLGAWERKVLAQMHGASIPATLGIAQGVWDSDETDTINAAIAEQGRALLLPQVLASYRQAHANLLAALEVYPEADYQKPGYPTENVHDADGTEYGPIVGYIAGNTYEHFAEHLEYIKRLV